MLGVNAAIINEHVEDATTAGNQLCVEAELLLDCRRQTGGLWSVVSLHAVSNADIHGAFFLSCDGFVWLVRSEKSCWIVGTVTWGRFVAAG